MDTSGQIQPGSPGPARDDFYARLSPEDRERAMYNLDRYFEIVLGIFLRQEAEQTSQPKRSDSTENHAIDNASVRA